MEPPQLKSVKQRKQWLGHFVRVRMYVCTLLPPSPKLSPKIELNRKRESELAKLRKDHEAQEQEHERVLGDMRKKHTEALRQLEEQLEASQKAKTKSVS